MIKLVRIMGNIINKLKQEEIKVDNCIFSYQEQKRELEDEYKNGNDYLDALYHYGFAKSDAIGNAFCYAIVFALAVASAIVWYSSAGLMGLLGCSLLGCFIVHNFKKQLKKVKMRKNKFKEAESKLSDFQRNALIEDKSLHHDLELRVSHAISDYACKIGKSQMYYNSLEEVIHSDNITEAIKKYIDIYPIYKQVLLEEWDEYLKELSDLTPQDLNLTFDEISDKTITDAVNEYIESEKTLGKEYKQV